MNGCFECGGLAEHEHHVVPESLGGTKTVPLCRSCHALAHGVDGVPSGWATPLAAPVLALAVELYAAEWSLGQIADFLNAAGVKPRQGKQFWHTSFLKAFRRLGVEIRPRGYSGYHERRRDRLTGQYA